MRGHPVKYFVSLAPTQIGVVGIACLLLTVHQVAIKLPFPPLGLHNLDLENWTRLEPLQQRQRLHQDSIQIQRCVSCLGLPDLDATWALLVDSVVRLFVCLGRVVLSVLPQEDLEGLLVNIQKVSKPDCGER